LFSIASQTMDNSKFNGSSFADALAAGLIDGRGFRKPLPDEHHSVRWHCHEWEAFTAYADNVGLPPSTLLRILGLQAAKDAGFNSVYRPTVTDI
jgi:hypothetical protein